MVSQRTAALVVFIGVVLIGLAFGMLVRARLRQLGWEKHGREATYFIKNLSENGDGEPLSGAKGVVVEKTDDETYLLESVDDTTITLSPGNHPQPEAVKAIIRKRETPQANPLPVAKTIRGFMVFDGNPYWAINWRWAEKYVSADLIGRDGKRMGVLKLIGKKEDVIFGEIQINIDGDRKTFDVFFPIHHPNITNAVSVVRTVSLPTREQIMDALRRSYLNSTQPTVSAE
ncbi:MAG: hypothetical protein HXS50_01870 [Theionarchaea archaeon]|nr:hypothetical protein [Theionarchaea archaeon]